MPVFLYISILQNVLKLPEKLIFINIIGKIQIPCFILHGEIAMAASF